MCLLVRMRKSKSSSNCRLEIINTTALVFLPIFWRNWEIGHCVSIVYPQYVLILEISKSMTFRRCFDNLWDGLVIVGLTRQIMRKQRVLSDIQNRWPVVLAFLFSRTYSLNSNDFEKDILYDNQRVKFVISVFSKQMCHFKWLQRDLNDKNMQSYRNT